MTTISPVTSNSTLAQTIGVTSSSTTFQTANFATTSDVVANSSGSTTQVAAGNISTGAVTTGNFSTETVTTENFSTEAVTSNNLTTDSSGYFTTEASTFAQTTTTALDFSTMSTTLAPRSDGDLVNALQISTIVFGVLAVILALLETSAWRRRQGTEIIDLTSILRFLLQVFSNVGNVLFFELFVYCIILIVYRNQQTIYPSDKEEQAYIITLAVGVSLKLVQLLDILITQSRIDMFLIDWEKPRATDGAKEGTKISIWRSYFIANEWNEIQTNRKSNTVLQLFLVVLILAAANFESATIKTTSSECSITYSNALRFGVGATTYIVVGIVQIIYFVFIHTRFFNDPIRDFVDLCSVANISVFVLSQRNFGYYIHGHSVHGRADTDMTEMNSMLKREEDNLVGTRGLEPNSEVQTFEMAVPEKLRHAFDKIYEPLIIKKLQNLSQAPETALSNESTKAYDVMKNFLTSFINHSLRDLDYIVKEKSFFEKLLGLELQTAIGATAFFSSDGGNNSFTDILFYGNEAALMIFDAFLFALLDLWLKNFTLAAVGTFVVFQIYAIVRQVFGRSNLAEKTLIDKRFLI